MFLGSFMFLERDRERDVDLLLSFDGVDSRRFLSRKLDSKLDINQKLRSKLLLENVAVSANGCASIYCSK